MNKYSLVLCVIVGLVSLTVAQMPPVVPTLNQVCDFQFQGTYSCPAPGYQGYNGSALFLSEQAYRSNLPDLLYNGYGCSDPTNPPSGSWFQTITTVGTGSLIADVTRLNWSVTNFTIDMLWYPTGGLNFTIQADAIVGHTYVVTHADFYSTNSIFVFTVLAIDRSVKIMYSVKEWANIVPTSVAPGFDAYAPSKPTCTNPIYPMSPSVMPTLNQVCQFTFNWTYSCSQGPKGNNAYNGSGLFLSQQALTYNSPDLFYNGYGCSDPTNPPLAGNYFQVSGNPNGASAIADVTANGWSVANFTVGELWFPTRSVQFAQTAPVVAGHTYVIQHADFSGNSGADLTNSIFIMTVVSVNSKAACTVQIAVKSWSAVANKAVSPGYSGGAPSVPTCGSSARR